MNKLIPKKPWQQLLLAGGILLIGWLGFHGARTFFTPPAPPSALNAMLQAMRAQPDAWTRVESDISIAVRDIQTNKVAGMAIAPAGLFVTAKDGRKYFVADNRGRFAELALSLYHKEGSDAFPLAVLASDPHDNYAWRNDPGTLLALLLFGGLVIYGLRVWGGGFKFARHATRVCFDDVVGVQEAKAALRDIQAYLKDPKRFAALGARPPKGVLLAGPPGTGKTRLAKALAGECNVNFIAATGGDFTAMFLGVGSMRVKSLFRKARKHAPCIIFIDEVDGIGRRTSTDNGGPSEAEGNRIINQILTEIDGFNAASGVIVIGATNFPDAVDPALLREGRFDRKIHLKLPDVADRESLFRLYTKTLHAAAEIDFNQLARLTTGLTPAAIAYVANHAALIAARSETMPVAMAHFVEAIEVCRIGEVNGSASALTEAERERIAVHEAGHAIVAQVLGVGCVEKVTILPRGGALGVTLVTQKEDKQLHLKSELENRIQMLLGGRAAEILTYNDASSGAASDLKEASRIALSMVTSLGLGDQGTLFNLEALTALNIKPDTAQAVAEAEAVLTTQNARCFNLLQAYTPALTALTEKLLQHETIDGSEVVAEVAIVRARLHAPQLESAGGLPCGAGMRVAQSPAIE